MGTKESSLSSPYEGLNYQRGFFQKLFAPSNEKIRKAQYFLDHPTEEVTDEESNDWKNEKIRAASHLAAGAPLIAGNNGYALYQLISTAERITQTPNAEINIARTQEAVSTLVDAGLLSPIRTPNNNITTIPVNTEVSISHTG